MQQWLWLVPSAVLGMLAARWLRTGQYRRAGDEVALTLDPRCVPVLAVLATAVAVPVLDDVPAVVLATCVLTLVWGLVLAVVDLEVLRLPDALVLRAYPVAAVLLSVCALTTGDVTALLRAAACAGAAVASFLLLALVSPVADGLGLGDVKLAGVLGAVLGWFGWSEALLGLVGAFAVGAVATLALLLLRRVRRDGSIPFGPSMLVGAYLACLASPVL